MARFSWRRSFRTACAGGLSGESGERTEPDDAEIVVGIAADLFGGEGCGAGEEFGLGLRAYVMMDCGLGASEERGGQGFVALVPGSAVRARRT
jgi:hypothetical protein